MTRYKILLPSDTNGWFESIMWNTQGSVGMEELKNKVHGIVSRPTEKIRFYLWNGSGYSKLGIDSDLMEATVKSHNVKEVSVIRIYVVLSKTDPSKIYGKPPYDNMFEGPDFTLQSDQNGSRCQNSHKLPKTKGSRRVTVATMQESGDSFKPQCIPRPISSHGLSAEGIWQTNFPSSGNSVTAQSELTTRKLSHQHTKSSYQPPASQLEEDELDVAVSTLRSMGYKQDSAILKFHIRETGGNLNDIIDRLHLHTNG
ncbi:unnamed protein product [Dicrocoelium dendriticum]|nr:unnamed protein product [Dicrocoelium dendriticum]